MTETDFLIIGAGIAGAGIAYRLASHARVLMMDMEDQAGYHTTGRSAAFYAETYGGPKLQPLTTASKAFLHNPPEGFTDTPLINPMGAIHIFREDQRRAAEETFKSLVAIEGVRLITRDEVLRRAPYLDGSLIAGGIWDPDCGNLDVAALHQGYLRAAKHMGAALTLGDRFEAAAYDGHRWHVKTRTGQIKARYLVNCAGAWADEVARRAGVQALALEPLRRTIITIPAPEGRPFDRHGPLIVDADEDFYFKPEGEGYLISPADESLSVPCDAQPEMEDVAMAADYFEKTTGAEVARIDAKWAGLRTFARDKAPVVGFASDSPAFFWNAGQGGYGIQTSPAWSDMAASLLLGYSLPTYLTHAGVRPEVYAPVRFGKLAAE
ncbi:NAD(P)/FAD-dependent oxidoreductase [Kordiimonas sp.]|uniref:NAD(P)/FAD-dependent oxidoreductase n=1 Tax=Kordiimonas sp. TaxID=1970157 RepID=UPI003A8CE694